MSDEDSGCVCPRDCLAMTRPEKVPGACPANAFDGQMQKARDEYRREGSQARIFWQAFTRLVGSGGASRSRLEHIMEFSRSVGYRRIGLAGCARYLPLMLTTRKILSQCGFESFSVACKIGGNSFADIGIEKESNWTLCNPLGQAYVLNAWNADLNVVFGLCMGHDLIFQHYSTAPTTTLVVKEKISDDNPVATLQNAAQGRYAMCPHLLDEERRE